MESLGQNLIFLISLPRSGSTLLQHILASHSSVGATAEPWVLFPTAYALRPQALTADYNAAIGQIALSEFLTQLDGGAEQYYAAVRKMALDLYNSFLAKHNKERFVDKTSRYYLILPELFRIFPQAKYIFLLRNPLAVLASFLESMVFGDWRRLGEPGIRNDLLEGYRLVRQGVRYFGDGAIAVRYEDLVGEPETTMLRLCEKLGLEFEPDMLQYGEKVGVLPGRLVDPKSIHRHPTVVADYADAWRSTLRTRQEKHFARAFLSHLGRELVNSLGYSYDGLEAAVSGRDEGRGPLVRWQVLMTPAEKRNHLQRWELDIAYVWQKNGAVGVFKHVGKGALRLAFIPVQAGWSILGRAARDLPMAHRVRRWMSGSREDETGFQALAHQQPASSDYQVLGDPSRLPSAVSHGWQEPSVAERQLEAYLPLLERMHQGNPRRDFTAAAQALRLANQANPTILEIGCGNGYYCEVLSYLAHCALDYTGLDYSPAMIESARARYPRHRFLIADATLVPFADSAFDIVWSGTVLMHLVDYKKAISETCRVARRFCVFHSTPVLADAPTRFLTKRAYGVSVAEVIINEAEFENLLRDCGLRIRSVLESLPYRVDGIVGGTVHTLTYLCEKSMESTAR